jgi:outer membrane protein OmpU
VLKQSLHIVIDNHTNVDAGHLLATTAMVLSAGVAAAEVALSGSASMGVARQAGGDFNGYSTAGVTFTMSGQSDSGLTFGAGFTLGAGQSYAFADDDGFDDGTPATSSEVYVAGGFGKVAMKINNDGLGQYKAYQTDDDKGFDLQYSHSMAGLDVGLRLDINDDTTEGDYSLSLGYAQDAVSASLAYDADGAWGASGSYTMGAITATLGTDDSSESSIKVAYAADGMSASAKFKTDDTWEVKAGYSANGMGFDLKQTSADKWIVSGSYDLGGGASLSGGINYTDDAYVGMSFSF